MIQIVLGRARWVIRMRVIEAQQLQSVNGFSLKLGKTPELATFEWQLPEPSQSTRGWEFVYAGEVPVAK